MTAAKWEATPAEAMLEVIALTELYLIQEYGWNGSIQVDRDSLSLFNFPKLSPKQKNPVQLQKANPPSSVAQVPLTDIPIQKKPEPPVQQPPPLALPKSTSAKPAPSPSPEPLKGEIRGKTIVLEPMPAASPPKFDQMQKIVGQLFPQLVFSAPPLFQRKTSGLSSSVEVLFVQFDESASQQLFIRNIVKAISQCLAPAAVLAAAQVTDSLSEHRLRLLIADPAKVASYPLLTTFLEKEKIPLFPIEHLGEYMQNPKKKAELWQQLILKITSFKRC